MKGHICESCALWGRWGALRSMHWAGGVPPRNGVARDEGMAVPHTPRARSGLTAASAAPTATSTRTWCRRWTRRPCAPAWCGRHRPCSASARCTGGCTGWAQWDCWALPAHLQLPILCPTASRPSSSAGAPPAWPAPALLRQCWRRWRGLPTFRLVLRSHWRPTPAPPAHLPLMASGQLGSTASPSASR